MENKLSLESLIQAIEKMKSNKDLLSIKPTRIIIPPKILKFLNDRGYTTQEEINKLINNITSKK